MFTDRIVFYDAHLDCTAQKERLSEECEELLHEVKELDARNQWLAETIDQMWETLQAFDREISRLRAAGEEG